MTVEELVATFTVEAFDELVQAVKRRLREQRLADEADDALGVPAIGDSVPLDVIEQAHVYAVLCRHDGNRKETAVEFDIGERTLYRRLERLEADRVTLP